MKKDKAYEELNKKLNSYLENSVNDVHIDDQAKDKIWKNISMEVHEKEMKRKYRTRRTFKVAVTVCVVIIALVSVDLSSNASLFRRLLTSVSGNTIQLHTRDSEAYEENRDEELDNEIKKINEEKGTEFIAPALINPYTFKGIVENNSTITIKLMDDKNNIIKINQKYINGDSSTNASFNNELFKMNTINKNGIEYNILIGDKINIVILLIGDIEIKVIGIDADDILEVALLLN